MILTAILLRHANSAGETNETRTLTTLGQEQAVKMREMLADTEFDIALHSPMQRTKQTLDIVLDGHDSLPVLEVPELFPTGDLKTRVMTAAGEVGIKAPVEYYNHPNVAHGQAISEHAEIADSGVSDAIGDVLGPNPGKDLGILIVGHAPFQAALAGIMLKDTEFQKMAESINLGECEGIKIVAEKNGDGTKVLSVEHLKLD